MSAKDIRNIVLLGHGGSGKTTLAESMLFMTGGTDRFGKVTDGNTTCDYDAEEIKRNISISLAVAPVKYKNVKINVLDTPGNFDFAGEVLSGIRAAECAVLVCGAKDGLSVGAERAWKMLGNKPRMIFINRTDEENSDYNACFDALKGKFGTAVAPIVAPIIDGSKKVTGIVDLLHNKAYEVKGGKAAACAIPADMADEVEALRAELLALYRAADLRPERTDRVLARFDAKDRAEAERVLESLLTGGALIALAPRLCLHREVYVCACALVRAYFADHEALTLAAFRDLLGTSRDSALLVLECLDRNGRTRREGDLRRPGRRLYE